MTKKEVKRMIKSLVEQEIVYEDKTTIELENPCYGEDIVFEFDDDGKLIAIRS